MKDRSSRSLQQPPRPRSPCLSDANLHPPPPTPRGRARLSARDAVFALGLRASVTFSCLPLGCVKSRRLPGRLLQRRVTLAPRPGEGCRGRGGGGGGGCGSGRGGAGNATSLVAPQGPPPPIHNMPVESRRAELQLPGSPSPSLPAPGAWRWGQGPSTLHGSTTPLSGALYSNPPGPLPPISLPCFPLSLGV